MKGIPAWSCSALVPIIPHSRFSLVLCSPAVQEEADAVSHDFQVNTKRAQDPGDCSWRSFFYYYNITYQITFFVVREVCFSTWSRLILQPPWKNSCGHTTDFYPGKTDLPRANSSKISRGKFISGHTTDIGSQSFHASWIFWSVHSRRQNVQGTSWSKRRFFLLSRCYFLR